MSFWFRHKGHQHWLVGVSVMWLLLLLLSAFVIAPLMAYLITRLD